MPGPQTKYYSRLEVSNTFQIQLLKGERRTNARPEVLVLVRQVLAGRLSDVNMWAVAIHPESRVETAGMESSQIARSRRAQYLPYCPDGARHSTPASDRGSNDREY